MHNLILTLALAATLAGCAGRAPSPVAIVQGHDQAADCAMLQHETAANVETLERLRKEKANKLTQNALALGAGIVVWPVLLAMDWQGAASKDLAALEQRQQHLVNLTTERCALRMAPSAKVTAIARH